MVAYDAPRRTPLVALVLILAVGVAFATCGLCSAYAAETHSNQRLATESINAQAANPASYRILFKANGGKGAMEPQIMKRGKQAALSANKFTRSGYKFAGWNTKTNGRGKFYKDKAKVKNLVAAGKTVTLYAQWKKSAIHELKVGKTYEKYDATGDGRADKVIIKGVAAANPTDGGVYRCLQVYVNGKKLLTTEDPGMPQGISPTVKLVNLASGPPLLYVRYMTHSGYYMDGWLYKLTSKKASLICSTSDIARLYSSGHPGAYRTYELLESVSGNELCFLTGSFSTDSTRYRYVYRNGKLVKK